MKLILSVKSKSFPLFFIAYFSPRFIALFLGARDALNVTLSILVLIAHNENQIT